MPFQQINSFLKQKKIPVEVVLFPPYLALGALFFIKGYRGELVDDGLAGLYKFQNQGWQGFWQSFGFTSLYYFHDIFVLTVYKMVGKSALGWFLVMVSLHSLNACLGFAMFKRLYAAMGIMRGQWIALAGSLLFLLSPYQTENVLWAATLHYAIALTIFLVSCIMLINALQSNRLRGRTIVLICVLYCIALMTVEISLIFPFAWFVLGAGVIIGKKTVANIWELIFKLIFPLCSLIVLYFIFTRLIKGHWLPHYGETHLLNNNIQTYSTHYACYLLKLLGYVHFMQYPTRHLIYNFCNKWEIVLAVEIVIPSLIFIVLWAQKKKAEARAFVLLAILAFILLLPSLHMFFMYLFNTQNDRLNYFFSLALYQIVALLLIVFISYAGIFIIFIYGVTGLFYLQQQANKWHWAGVMQDNCIRSFIWTDAPKIYVLNEAANFNGAYVFRNDERLLYALDLFKNYNHPERVVQIFSSYSTSPADSTVVQVLNDSTLNVKTITGGWLMREAVGATDYGTDDFYAVVDRWNPGYTVTFHRKVPGAVYIYSTSYGFRQLKGF